MTDLKKYRDRVALSIILLLAGVLSVFGIWNEGYGNTFYAASVKSMLASWKNFFFVSFDPGGWITVDKPPVAFWIQTAFAKVFGFYGWSLILPECLAAVATVAILYHVVKHNFGTLAGLVSALVLALSPIFIVISKTNNMDSILILLMVLASWAMMAAAEKGQLRYLILSAVFLGAAYNTKTLEAFLILPALFAAYFFASEIKWRKRVWHLAVATLVLTVVSLSWSVIVDLTPASARPYVDNSTQNSEIELALGYNGIQRITGENKSSKSESTNTATKGSNGETQGAALAEVSSTNKSTSGGVVTMNGSAGITRMFNATLGGQDSWFLPFGFLAIFALILRMRKKSCTDMETRKKILRNVLLWGLSILTMFGYFSVAGFFHAYYIAVMAPFIAALTGIGLVEMWKMYQAEDWTRFLLPIAFAITLVVQLVMIMNFPSYAPIMIPIIAVVTGIPTIALVVPKLKLSHKNLSDRIAVSCVSIAIAGLLIAPTVWIMPSIVSITSNSFNAQTPSAGPNAKPGQSKESMSNSSEGQLISFLEQNNTDEKFLIAVPGASDAEPIILATGKPVLSVGGFSGSTKTLTVEKLEQMVEAGEIRYFMVGGLEGAKGAQSDELTEWVKSHGEIVDQSKWSDPASSGDLGEKSDKSGSPATLYDLS